MIRVLVVIRIANRDLWQIRDASLCDGWNERWRKGAEGRRWFAQRRIGMRSCTRTRYSVLVFLVVAVVGFFFFGGAACLLFSCVVQTKPSEMAGVAFGIGNGTGNDGSDDSRVLIIADGLVGQRRVRMIRNWMRTRWFYGVGLVFWGQGKGKDCGVNWNLR